MNINTITFTDLEEPSDELAELMLLCVTDAIATNLEKYDGDVNASILDIHAYIDTFVTIITDIQPQANVIEYLLSHDGMQFVFNPGNIFTCNMAKKMQNLQEDSAIRFNTTLEE